jgi:hypothetical protein
MSTMSKPLASKASTSLLGNKIDANNSGTKDYKPTSLYKALTCILARYQASACSYLVITGSTWFVAVIDEVAGFF